MACLLRGNSDDLGARLVLTNSFVGSVEKGLVFDDGFAAGCTKLDAAEGRNRARRIKEILGIKDFVAIEEKRGSVKIVRTALGDGVDDRTGRSSVFRGVIARKNGKFLDAIDA